MSAPQDKIAELRVKQLEMVQAIIARIAGYGAEIKNWCITVTTAVCGFSVTVQKPVVVLLALLPIVTFAFLDAQYLRVERQFRNTFDQFSREKWDVLPSFDLGHNAGSKIPLVAVLFSWSIVSFYIPLVLGVAVVMFVETFAY
jgi:hypothetical protein